MAISAKSPQIFFLFFIIASFLTTFIATAESDSDRVAELLHLQSRSKNGVIHLDDNSMARFFTSAKPSRSYSLLVFFDAVQLHDKPELHLQDLRSEFGLLASSFITNNQNSPSQTKLFFCEIEFKQSQSSFSQFGVNSLPHIRLVAPQAQNPKDTVAMDQGDFSRLAESMADFVESKTKLTVGQIHRPPMFSKKQIGFIALALMIWTPFLIKKLLLGQTLLHDPKVWLGFSIFVYFFSVSGAMHNIIRKMPMFLADRNDPSKLIFFYQGSGMQLGAEGFAIGFLYTIVGLLLSLVIHVLVRVRNVNVQRVVMIVSLLVSFWAVKKVVYLDNWKTGYGVHGFWPSSWK